MEKRWRLKGNRSAVLSEEGGTFAFRVEEESGAVVEAAAFRTASAEAVAVGKVIDAASAPVPVEAPASPVEAPASPVEAPASPVEAPASPVEAPASPVEAAPALNATPPASASNYDIVASLAPGDYTLLRYNDMGFPSVFAARVVAVRPEAGNRSGFGRPRLLVEVLHRGDPRKPKAERRGRLIVFDPSDDMPVFVWRGTQTQPIEVRERMSSITQFDAEQIRDMAAAAVAAGAGEPVVSGSVGGAWAAPRASGYQGVREADNALDRATPRAVAELHAAVDAAQANAVTLPASVDAAVATVAFLQERANRDDVAAVTALVMRETGEVSRVERLRSGAVVTMPDHRESEPDDESPVGRYAVIEMVSPSSDDRRAAVSRAGTIASMMLGEVLGDGRRNVLEATCGAGAGDGECLWSVQIPWTKRAVSEDEAARAEECIRAALFVEGVTALDFDGDLPEASIRRARELREELSVVTMPAPTVAPAAPQEPASPVEASTGDARYIVTIGLKLSSWAEAVELLPGGTEKSYRWDGARASWVVDVDVDRVLYVTAQEYDDFVVSLMENREAWFKGVLVVEVSAPGRNRIYVRTEGHLYARYVGFDAGTDSEWKPLSSEYEQRPVARLGPSSLRGNNMERLGAVTRDPGRIITILAMMRRTTMGAPSPLKIVARTVSSETIVDKQFGHAKGVKMVLDQVDRGSIFSRGELTFGEVSVVRRGDVPIYVYDGDVAVTFPDPGMYSPEKSLHVAAASVEEPPLVAGMEGGCFAPTLFSVEDVDPSKKPENKPHLAVGARAVAVKTGRHGAVSAISTTWSNGHALHSFSLATDGGKVLTYLQPEAIVAESGEAPTVVRDVEVAAGNPVLSAGFHTPQEVLAKAAECDERHDAEMARKSRAKSTGTQNAALAAAKHEAQHRDAALAAFRRWAAEVGDAPVAAVLAEMKLSPESKSQRAYLLAVRSGIRSSAPAPAAQAAPAQTASVLPRDVPAAPTGSDLSVLAIGVYLSNAGKRRVAVKTVRGGACGEAISEQKRSGRGNWHWAGGTLQWWSAPLDFVSGPNTSARRLVQQFVPSFNPDAAPTFSLSGDESGGESSAPAVEATEPAVAAVTVAAPTVSARVVQYADAIVVDVSWEDGARMAKKTTVRGRQGTEETYASPNEASAAINTAFALAAQRLNGSDYQTTWPEAKYDGHFGMKRVEVTAGEFTKMAGNWKRGAVLVIPPRGVCRWVGGFFRSFGYGYSQTKRELSLGEAMGLLVAAITESLGAAIRDTKFERVSGVAPVGRTVSWPDGAVPMWTSAAASDDMGRTVSVADRFVPIGGERAYFEARPVRAVIVHADDAESQAYRYRRAASQGSVFHGELAKEKVASKSASSLGRGPTQSSSRDGRRCGTFVEVVVGPRDNQKTVFAELAEWSPSEVEANEWTDAERRLYARALSTIDARDAAEPAWFKLSYYYGDQLGEDGRREEVGWGGIAAYFAPGETTATKIAAVENPAAGRPAAAEQAASGTRRDLAETKAATDKEIRAKHNTSKSQRVADLEAEIASILERRTSGRDAARDVAKDAMAALGLGLVTSVAAAVEFVEANGGRAEDVTIDGEARLDVADPDGCRKLIFFVRAPRVTRMAALARLREAFDGFVAGGEVAGVSVSAQVRFDGRQFGDKTSRFEVMCSGPQAAREAFAVAIAVPLVEAAVAGGAADDRRGEQWTVESLDAGFDAVIRLRSLQRRQGREPVIDSASFVSPLPATEAVRIGRTFDAVYLSVVVSSAGDVERAKSALRAARVAVGSACSRHTSLVYEDPYVAVAGEGGDLAAVEGRDVRIAVFAPNGDSSFQYSFEKQDAALDAAEASFSAYAAGAGAVVQYAHKAQTAGGFVVSAWCASNQRVTRAKPLDAAAFSAALELVASTIVSGGWEYLFTFGLDKSRLTPAMIRDAEEKHRGDNRPMIAAAFAWAGVKEGQAGEIVGAYNRVDRSTRLKWAKGQQPAELRTFLASALYERLGLTSDSLRNETPEKSNHSADADDRQPPLVPVVPDGLYVAGVKPEWSGNNNFTSTEYALTGYPPGAWPRVDRKVGTAIVRLDGSFAADAVARFSEVSTQGRAWETGDPDGVGKILAELPEDFRKVVASAESGAVVVPVALQRHPRTPGGGDVLYVADESRELVCPVHAPTWAAVVNWLGATEARIASSPEDESGSRPLHGGVRVTNRDPAWAVVLYARRRPVAVVYHLPLMDAFSLRFVAGPRELAAPVPPAIAEKPASPPAPPPEEKPAPAPELDVSEEEMIARMLGEELGL